MKPTTFGTALAVLLVITSNAIASDLPPCDQRPSSLAEPWIRAGSACIEGVIADAASGAFAFAALVAGDDGVLYAAHADRGEIVALTDSDGDGLPDRARMIASGLAMPTALAVAPDGVLYAADRIALYRLDGAGETVIALLPPMRTPTTALLIIGDALWLGLNPIAGASGIAQLPRDAIANATAEALVVTPLGSPPDATIAALTLTTDGTVYALLAEPASLLALDARGQVSGAPIALEPDSQPRAIAAYRGGSLTHLEDRLIIVLHGSYNRVDLRGYSLVSVEPLTGQIEALMPAQPGDTSASDFSNAVMNYRGSGFFPNRPLAVAVSAEGWVYISATSGRLIALRPR